MQDKAPITKQLVKKLETDITVSVDGATSVVQDAEKQLNAENYERYRIKDFYKRGRIIKALESVKLKHTYFADNTLEAVFSDTYKHTFIDNDIIKRHLLAHSDVLLNYFDSLINAEILVTHHNFLPAFNESEFKTLTKFVINSERTLTHTTTQADIDTWQETIDKINAKKHPDGTPYTEDEKRKIYGYTTPKPELGKETSKTYKGLTVKNAKELLQRIKGYPIIDDYRLVTDNIIDSRLASGMEQIYDLAVACNIPIQAIEHRLTLNINDKNKHITSDHYAILDFITEALVSQLKPYIKTLNDKYRVSTPVNIRHDYNGNYIPKPPIETTYKDLENENPEKYNTLTKIYRTNEALQEDNGLIATITDPTILDNLPVEYQDPVKMLTLLSRTNRRGFITCFRYAQDNPNPPDVINIEDIAQYNLAYAEQIKKHGYLPTAYKTQLGIELSIVQKVNTSYTYYDKKLRKQMLGSIKFFDFEISDDCKIIKGFRYTQEYIDKLNDKKQVMLHLAIPSGIDLISQTAQDVAYKIILLFVGKDKQMNKTIKGEPLTITLSDLYKGILSNATTKQQRQKRKDKIIKALEEIKASGDVIANYEMTYKNKKWYVTLYPAEYTQKAYKDPELDKALKQARRDDQATRQADLEKTRGHL